VHVSLFRRLLPRRGQLEFHLGRVHIGVLPRGVVDYAEKRKRFGLGGWLFVGALVGIGALLGWLIWG
jgi:hypothetical protein